MTFTTTRLKAAITIDRYNQPPLRIHDALGQATINGETYDSEHLIEFDDLDLLLGVRPSSFRFSLASSYVGVSADAIEDVFRAQRVELGYFSSTDLSDVEDYTILKVGFVSRVYVEGVRIFIEVESLMSRMSVSVVRQWNDEAQQRVSSGDNFFVWIARIGTEFRTIKVNRTSSAPSPTRSLDRQERRWVLRGGSLVEDDS